MRRALALGLVLVALPAAAAVFRSATVEEAARGSDAVVRGRVEKKVARLSADGSRILTDVTVSVASAWKGSPGASVTVTVPGGVLGDKAQWVDAAPDLEVGEEVVLFLAKRAQGWNVNGLALGKFRVEGEQVRSGAATAEVLPAPAAAGERALTAPMTVGELERRVRAAK